jgi:Activator of Hsp90 ATPase homolog 1-like protein
VFVISNDSVTVSTVVDTDPDSAFRIFTEEIDVWWKRTERYRSRNGRMRFDAGHLFEADQSIGQVTAWEPGRRLSLEMFTWSFRPGERTHVEVRFEAVANGTRVIIEHRGWERRPTGEAEFRTTVALWWGALLPAFKYAMSARTPNIAGPS